MSKLHTKHSTSVKPSAAAVNAAQVVLRGNHATVAEAFVHDKKMLEEAATKHGNPLSQNSGVMAGATRRR